LHGVFAIFMLKLHGSMLFWNVARNFLDESLSLLVACAIELASDDQNSGASFSRFSDNAQLFKVTVFRINA